MVTDLVQTVLMFVHVTMVPHAVVLMEHANVQQDGGEIIVVRHALQGRTG